METLLVSKNGIAWSATVAAGTANSITLRSQLDVLKDGSLTAFQEDGTRIVTGGSFTKTQDYGYFFLGTPAGVATRKSPRINFGNLVYRKKLAVAAVAQTSVMGDDGFVALTTGDAFTTAHVGMRFVATQASVGADFTATAVELLKVVSTGLNLAASAQLVLGAEYEVIAAGAVDNWGTPAGILASSLAGTLTIGTKAVGASYGVNITDLTKEGWERRNWNVDVVLTSASMTDAAMLAAFVAAFNAHEQAKLIATASVTTGDAGVKFVGVNAGESFAILPTGLFYSSTVTSNGAGVSDRAVVGEGTNAQILALELATSMVEGRTGTYVNDELAEIWTFPSMVEAGQTYVVYVLEWSDQRTWAYPSNNANPNFKRLNIAVPSGDSTMITAVDQVLSDLGTLQS